MCARLKPPLAASGGHHTAGRGRSISMSPSSSHTASCIVPRQVPSASHSSGRTASLRGAAYVRTTHCNIFSASAVPHNCMASILVPWLCPPVASHMGKPPLSSPQSQAGTNISNLLFPHHVQASLSTVCWRAPAPRSLLRLRRKVNVPRRLHTSAVLTDVEA